MSTPEVLLVVGLLLSQTLVGPTFRSGAASWEDAYRKGDYRKAAELLQPLVAERFSDPSMDDPTPARHLAKLYATGQGVPYDPIAACALIVISGDAASAATHGLLPDLAAYDAGLRDDARIVAQYCDGLAERDRLAAHRSAGCFAFGMPEQIVPLGSELVWIGRGGIRLADHADEKIDSPVNCPTIIARARSVSVDPPPEAEKGVTTRHFIELLAWFRGAKPGSPSGFTLQVYFYELQDKAIGLAGGAELRTSATWPTPALPRDVEEGFSLEMTSKGDVRWHLTGTPRRSGELPSRSSR